jgi:hypothetical protein
VSNADPDFGAFESIATFTYSSITTGVTFSSIPQTYKHLQIRYMAQDADTVGTIRVISMQFNGDSGSNYKNHTLTGDGASASSAVPGSVATVTSGNTLPDASSTNIFARGVIDILDYANTNKYKTVRYLSGHDRNGAGTVTLASGVWMSTSAVSSIAIGGTSRTYSIGTQFALYGIKG